MSEDFLRQWQQWAAAFDPAAASARPWWTPPPPASPGYAQMFEQFAAAARAFQGPGTPGTGTSSAAGGAEAAARAFGDWLRDQFRDPGALWGNQAFAASAAPPWGALPAVGPLREHQLRAERAARAWQRAEEARQRCARLWSDMLREAAEAFARRLGIPGAGAATAMPGSTPPAADARQLYDQWIAAAEAAYARMAHSDEFIKAQGEFLNAGSELRRELAEYAENCAKFLDLPTRAELDTVHERLRALQSLVQKLEAELAKAQAGGKAG